MSSASTWVTNVVRPLLTEYSDVPLVKGFADTLSSLPPLKHKGHVMLKSHHPAADLILLNAANATKTILTIRDPRDCVASLTQRFGRSFQQSVQDISSGLARLDALTFENVLPLYYEDRFFERVETVILIAEFLELRCGSQFAKEIAARFSLTNVKAFVQSIVDMPPEDVRQHVDSIVHKETGFHTNHVTDARSGKFRELLTPLEIQFVDATMGYAYRQYGYLSTSVPIPPAYFRITTAAHFIDEFIAISAKENSECAIFGPYIHLPKGNWTADFITSGECAVDIASGGESIAGGLSTKPLAFELRELSECVEFRVYTASQENIFRGVTLARRQ
jgi:hypothetical protein